MSTSVKSQIIERLLALCQPLIAENKVRKVVRVRGPFLLESIKDAIHLVVGDEVVIGEDVRGFELQFPVMFKLIIRDAADAYAKSDQLEAWLQEKIEGDPQLQGGAQAVANRVVYQGSLPFTEEALKPDGGTVLMYEVFYRRERAKPDVSY